jgi:hypothetical protein
MKMRYFLTSLALVLPLAMSAAAQARTGEGRTQWQAYQNGGREVAAPPYSDACMTDHGPSQCGEPMWVYGTDHGARERYRGSN